MRYCDYHYFGLGDKEVSLRKEELGSEGRGCFLSESAIVVD